MLRFRRILEYKEFWGLRIISQVIYQGILK